MSFDKAKAMRNAERYVAQGKIRAAIDEYRSVVDNDPRDMTTLNMLGDLYSKTAEKREAVNCYMQVADHYNTQGFSQKAIAVYNKIARIQPDSIEVSAKLAELHKVKGSLSDARSHYMTLAEHYQSSGKRLEALAMFKQIALLDPNNTEVCLNLAESYVKENQRDEALESYAEAGARFTRQNRHEEAIRALMKGFDIKSTDLRILNGLVKAQTALGRATKAVSLLEEIIENEPYNRDVLYLLIECCIDSQNAAGAEKAVIKLVEIEPANYPKFLDLIRIYLNSNDANSAARILTMSAEYLLAGGQADECGKWINEILERDPAQLDGLRLLLRYNSWLHDPNGVRLALERLYLAASEAGSVDDERYALAQLVTIRPHEVRYRDRLNEINEQHGYADDGVDESLWTEGAEEPEPVKTIVEQPERVQPATEYDLAIDKGEEEPGQIVDAEIITEAVIISANGNGNHPPRKLSASEELRLQSEIESIGFYIDNDYRDLAEKSIAALEPQFGDQPQFIELRRRFAGDNAVVTPAPPPPPAPVAVAPDPVAQAVVHDTASGIGIDEIRSEFGLDGPDAESGTDYETHFQMGIAYQEMGLLEDAIREFQDAANLTTHADGTRRFFYCSNLLGHCFLQNGMAQHAITWFNRALEGPGISDEEQHGVWYELALAHAANGQEDVAARYFEQIYAENVDFRDVGERVREPATH